MLIAYFSKDKAIAPVLNTPIQWLWRKWPVLEMITSFFPFLGFSPSGTQFYEAIVGSSSKPPFLLASKRKKNILTFFWVKKNRHRWCTGFSEVHQLSQKISREYWFDGIQWNIENVFSTIANYSIACGLIDWSQLHLEFESQCKQNSDQNSSDIF